MSYSANHKTCSERLHPVATTRSNGRFTAPVTVDAVDVRSMIARDVSAETTRASGWIKVETCRRASIGVLNTAQYRADAVAGLR